MKRVPRPESVITGGDNLELLQRLPNFPVFIGATEQAPDQDLRADMDWYICRESGVIQLTSLLPPELVYSAYHSEAIGGIWQQHHDRFVDFCSRYAIGDVLEIGGSNGYIAQNYLARTGQVGWTIVEPNPGFQGDEKVQVIKGFFDKSFLRAGYRSIVHSHVVEHAYNPDQFLRDISEFLADGQFQIFSVPNLYQYLVKKFSNTINFEHTYLLTESLLDYLLAKNSFEIVEKHYFADHSIFYATRKNSQVRQVPLVNHVQEYERLYREFIRFYKDEVRRLNALIEERTGPIFLFGAHIFSQFLIYLGLHSKKINCVLDNSTAKEGKRLYGTDQKVALPTVISCLDPVTIILKAGQYQEEVRKQLLSINPQAEIWE